jgi:hypothetical protein
MTTDYKYLGESQSYIDYEGPHHLSQEIGGCLMVTLEQDQVRASLRYYHRR